MKMKQFILGIDGGDRKILESFNMPFLKKIISDNEKLNLTEDLLTRGWAEILTGEKAYSNNSFYIKPDGSGKPKSTLSYKYSDMKTNSKNQLIWELAEAKELNVGIMNIPTTYPAPKVRGFFVSGAGGGLYKVDNVPLEMCDSELTRDNLEENDYEVELRFKPSGIKDPASFFNSLNSMMKKRVNTYIKLCKSQNTDFGFLALRATANMQYVVMREIQAYMDQRQEDRFWKELLEEHYELLDKLIEKLFTELQPQEFIITSDHGQVPLLYHINFNVLLSELGYLTFKKSIKKSLKFYFKSGRNFLGQKILNKNYSLPSSGKIDFTKTKAFGFWYSNGLYINDSKRFGGEVTYNEYEKLVKEVCSRINKYPMCKQNNISAVPLRNKFINEKFEENIPDIWINAPDIYFFRNIGKNFIQKNDWYRPITKGSFASAPSSMFTGIKGKNPLCILSKGLKKYVLEDDDMDLSIIYFLTNRYMQDI